MHSITLYLNCVVFQTLGYPRIPCKSGPATDVPPQDILARLGRTFQQYPQPLIHILRELLCIYLPQECRVGNVIVSPKDVFTWLNGDTSRDELTNSTAGMPTLKSSAQLVWPGVR